MAIFSGVFWWSAYVLLPVVGWGLLDGAPLRGLELVVLATLWWWWGVTKRVGGTWIAIACIALKIGAGVLLLPHGFTARYFANDGFIPPFERSLEYSGIDFTRVDSRLAFGHAGLPDLPAFFFNDHTRFNFYQRGQPDRATLPFSATWDGYAWVEEGERARTFYLYGSAIEAELLVDQVVVLKLAAGAGHTSAPVFYPKGWRHLALRMRVPAGAARDVEAGSIGSADAIERPLGEEPVYRIPVSRTEMRVDRTVRMMSRVLDVGLLAALAWMFVNSLRKATPIALAWILVVADALLHARRFAGRLVLLPGGDDSLTYESQARDIVLNGPLMLFGTAPGQAEAFYYQPLYGYAVALVHSLFGEDLWGLYLVQRLLLFVTLVLVWNITARLFGTRAGHVSLVIGGLFLYTHREWELSLWGENFFVPLICAWALLLIDFVTPRDGRTEARTDAIRAGTITGVIAGVVGGLAILSRSTLMLAFVPIVPVVVVARRRNGQSAAVVLVMLLATASVVGLSATRNWIASGQFVPLTTSFSINLFLGNAPPPDVPVHDVKDHALYRWFAVADTTRAVVEFARHAPVTFLKNLGLKALYTLGIFEPLVPGAGYSIRLMALIAAAAVGFYVVARRPLLAGRKTRLYTASVDAGEPGAGRLIPLAISASLFAAVIVIFPTHARLILPSYVPLLPYAAVAGAFVLERLFPRTT